MQTPPIVAIQLRLVSLVWHFLDADLHRSAVFYAERLFCLDQTNHDSRHLYATAMLRAGQTPSAAYVVTNLDCLRCAEIYARCCAAQGRNRQGRDALQESLRRNGAAGLMTSAGGLREVRSVKDEAAVQCLMGNMAVRGNQSDLATQHFLKCLALNPLIWEAYEGLASQSSFPELDNMLTSRSRIPSKRPAPTDDPMGDIDELPLPPPVTTGLGFFTPSTNAAGPSVMPGAFNLKNPAPPRVAAISRPAPPPPLAGPSKSSGIPFRQAEGRPPAPKKPRSQTAVAPTRPPAREAPKASSSRSTSVDAGGVRRSNRIAGVPKPIVKPPPPIAQRTKRMPLKPPSKGKEPAARLGDMREPPRAPSPSSPSVTSLRSEASAAPNSMWAVAEQIAQEQADQDAADQYIMDLVRTFAKAVRALANYRCRECIEVLNKLPECQQRCAWVNCLIGRAQYEMTDYINAERAFQKARLMDPHRQQDMEIYSTLLWHLHREVPLSFLAQELVASDERAAQAWVAVGNCFSLQREHAHAQTCFRRAARLAPAFAYAYTLSGHEALATDETEKAQVLFQTAVRTDNRHYNAWYGLGRVYLKQGKLRMAEYHFRKAVELNPSNAVLVCCVGTVLEKRGMRETALQVYDAAHSLAPSSAMVLFRRTKLLVDMERYEEALRDLIQLRDTVPEEANVAFTLGRVHLLMGDRVEATRTLAIAQDLDHRLGGAIKALLEQGEDGQEADGEGGEPIVVEGGGEDASASNMEVEESAVP